MLQHQRIAGFDGIRALAVAFVVLQHLGVWQLADQAGFIRDKLAPLLSGGTGVQAFFILSGFLITLLLIKERQTTGTVSIVNFMVRRSLRILPLYLLFCVLATLAFLVLNNNVPSRSLAYAFLYAYNFVPTKDYVALLGHTWSLAVEEHFYLVWPLVFAAGFARGRKPLIAALALFVIFSLALHFVLSRHPVSHDYFISRWSFIAGSSIAVGCIGALLVTGFAYQNSTTRIFAKPLALLSGLVLFANSLYIDIDSWFIQNVALGYIRSAGLLLIVLWIYENQNSALVKVLEIRMLRYLGTISYGIYMWQGFFLSTGPKRLPNELWPPNQYIGFAMLVVIAPLSYRYFEQPFLSLKKRYAGTSERKLARMGQ
jgi:peptidoglycan/LPS O-acetylase OafA/YrhL